MFDKFQNERIGNAVIFFVKKTKNCGITKLNKLLYFADFLTFRRTGKSLTGYFYEAWDEGPVPQPFYDNFRNVNDEKSVPEYLSEYIDRDIKHITEEQYLNIFIPKKEFDSDYFSKVEMDILKSLAKRYKLTKSEDIVDDTHKTIPYKKAYKKGENNKIDYFDSIENDEIIFKDAALPREELKERQEDFYFLKQVLS